MLKNESTSTILDSLQNRKLKDKLQTDKHITVVKTNLMGGWLLISMNCFYHISQFQVHKSISSDQTTSRNSTKLLWKYWRWCTLKESAFTFQPYYLRQFLSFRCCTMVHRHLFGNFLHLVTYMYHFPIDKSFQGTFVHREDSSASIFWHMRRRLRVEK